jgi:hypothetical protein
MNIGLAAVPDLHLRHDKGLEGEGVDEYKAEPTSRIGDRLLGACTELR